MKVRAEDFGLNKVEVEIDKSEVLLRMKKQIEQLIMSESQIFSRDYTINNIYRDSVGTIWPNYIYNY